MHKGLRERKGSSGIGGEEGIEWWGVSNGVLGKGGTRGLGQELAAMPL